MLNSSTKFETFGGRNSKMLTPSTKFETFDGQCECQLLNL